METKEFDLEKYIPKGGLIGFPKEVILWMLDNQEAQGNERNVEVFEKNISANDVHGGFFWNKTKEGGEDCVKIIIERNFNLFFTKCGDKSFHIGDKVIDLIFDKIGEIVGINAISRFSVEVKFDEFFTGLYTKEGYYQHSEKRPRLLHYVEGFNYDKIDFKNLPFPKRLTIK